MQSRLFCRTNLNSIYTHLHYFCRKYFLPPPPRSLLKTLKNLNVLNYLLEAAPIVTFVLLMIRSASIAAVTTWMVPLEKKNKQGNSLLKKSDPQKVST